jgi:[phosphatase 2A protein]-leucine-carboxy methyltransferase
MRQPSEIISKLLKQCKLDPQLPTLFIFECVLVYMSGDHSSALLSALASTFQSCALVNYEQVNLSDKFGSIMLANMEARSCKLLGVDACSSIDAQRERFTRAGFTGPSQVITMTDFYRTKMHAAERERIESIEFLDESELLFQLMDHYCICVVTNSSDLGDILF